MSERDGDSPDVLLVEDNPGDVRLIEEAFKEGNIATTLHVVADGIEAVDFLYQRGDHEDSPQPDVILLDLNLPRKNGQEVLEELRNDDDLQIIPVIILTSSRAEEDVVKSYNLYANAYLTKPVDPEKFIETIQRFKMFWLESVRLPVREDR
ncbi:response regulator [Haloprofundus salilacus]|uniref:response regulator n=1 Tax=Haloprofundus salilacus TaxID=2876190 RepID=UPI001CC99250|nr:response regulator [Haloprofundus salilacus]